MVTKNLFEPQNSSLMQGILGLEESLTLTINGLTAHCGDFPTLRS